MTKLQINSAKKGETALDFILDHPKPFEFVQNLPTTDLLFLIKNQGLEDSLDVLNFLSSNQVKEIIDLDGWAGETLSPKHLGEWLYALNASNPEKAAQHFVNLDIELISLLLLYNSEFYELSEDTPFPDLPSETIYTQTPDRLYLIVFNADSDEKLVYFLKSTLEILMGKDMRYVHRLVESVRWETPSTLEEEALRWREARMMDLGFPSTDEAKSILSYLPDGAINATEQASNPHSSDEAASNNHIVSQSFKKFPGLQKSLADLSAENQQLIVNSIISTTNHVHLAQNGRLGDVETLKHCSQYTLCYLEMGLLYLAKKSGKSTTEVLTQYTTKALFQTGRSLVLRLKIRTQRFLSAQKEKLGAKDFEAPLKDVLAGLMQPEPLFYEGLAAPEKLTFRPFQSITEVANTAKCLQDFFENL